MNSLAALNTGNRYSIQRTTALLYSGRPLGLALMSCSCVRRLADADQVVAGERVLRHHQIDRRRPSADSSGGIVVRAVTGAEPAAVVALGVARGLAERHAAEVGAHADHHQPLR